MSAPRCTSRPRWPFLQWDLPAAAATDELGALLFELGAAGVETRDDTTFTRGPGGGLVRLLASFDSLQAAEKARLAVDGLVAGARVEVGEIVGDEWRDKYKEYFKPFRVGALTIVPPWEPEAATGLHLLLDPGRAFGTGLHATTRLTLEALQELGRIEGPVLDVGTGSGILGLCAARLGASHVRAVDVDPIAVEVARENAALNRLTERVSIDGAPLDAVEGTFSVVVANIRTSVLTTMVDALRRLARPGAEVLLSGILGDEEDEVLRAFSAGFDHVASARCEEGTDRWVCLRLRRASPLRVPLSFSVPGRLPVTPELRRYLAAHRLGRRGVELVVFSPEERLEGYARVDGDQLEVVATWPATAVPRRQVTVIQAAGKGAKIADVLRDATELGATRFVVALTERCVKRPTDKHRARWRRVAIEAARQCGRGDVPVIEGPLPLDQALGGAPPGWLLHPGATVRLGDRSGAASSLADTLVIGPEGGFSDAEIELAGALGYVPCRLGDFTLRTETACAAALGALHALARAT